ncbi:unnamed protein product [Miscanthus lutarioriparius]|uniref:Uncharacterized protein n=1 Tax=Miscanthus lutarioriparius TaxID=422564 RepID=A0A811QBG2_9POAL|nr:unnamed protein product [Miscanthus lutarioriparius]
MMAAAPMEAQTAQPPSDPSSAAAYPRWVMLEPDMKIQAEGSSCSTSDASKTLAAEHRAPDPSLPPPCGATRGFVRLPSDS